MKHTYKTPSILIVRLASERALLEGSLFKSNTPVSESNGGWVKEDNVSSSSRYNVWDDDWSD